MRRAAVFIDGGYLAKVLEREYDKARIDFSKFSDIVCEGYERLRTYYYYCMPYQSNPPTEEEKLRYANAQMFISRISKLPRFEVRLGKLKPIDHDFRQKKVDVMLAVDMVRMGWSKQVDLCVLVSGDSDFTPAVKAVKDAGVITRLCYSKRSVHDEILSEVDERYEITKELIEKSKL